MRKIKNKNPNKVPIMGIPQIQISRAIFSLEDDFIYHLKFVKTKYCKERNNLKE